MAPTPMPPHLGTLVLLTAISVLTLNMFLPALPTMREDFGVSEAVMGLSISGYMVCAAVFQLALGPLSDRFGRRPVMLGVLVIYVATSVLCLSAQSIELFLVARSLQAVAVGGAVLSSAVVRDMFTGRAAASKLGTIGAMMAVAPMLAPVLGGILDATLGWQAIFVAYSAIGLAALALVWVDMGETGGKRQGRSLREGIPALMGERLFWAYTAAISFGVGSFYIFVTGAPFVAADVFGLTSDQIGIGLGSISGGYMLGAIVSSRAVERIGPDPLILSGRLLPLVGLIVAFGVFVAGAGSVWVLFAATMCVGIGNGLTLPSANAAALSVRPEMAGTAAGVSGATVLVTGAVLSGGVTAVLSAQATSARLIAIMLVAVGVSLAAALLARKWSRV